MPRLGSTAARLKLKGIDGGPHKRRSMWLNSTQREEPYQGLTYTGNVQRWAPPCGRCTGGAWLSSARVVRCWVKSRNERNPCPVLPAGPCGAGDSRETAGVNSEEGGDDVKSSWSLRPGLHTCYNGRDRGSLAGNGRPIPKPCLSSDCRLQPDGMKLESLVIVDQLRHGEFVPGPCTHRPSRHGSWECPKSVTQPQGGSGRRRAR